MQRCVSDTATVAVPHSQTDRTNTVPACCFAPLMSASPTLARLLFQLRSEELSLRMTGWTREHPGGRGKSVHPRSDGTNC